jgi:hypothetical protein
MALIEEGNKMRKYIKTFPKILKTIFVGSLLFLLIQQLFLFDIDPVFPKAYELAILFQNIVLALIASIIFYFIIQHVPKIIKRSKLLVFLKNTSFEVQIFCRDIT